MTTARPSMPFARFAAAVLGPGLLLLAGCGGDGAPDDGSPAGSAAADGKRDTAPAPETAAMDGMEMDGAASTVELEPGQADRIGLRWGVATPEPIVRTVRLSATVRYPESRMEWVSPKVSGWVEKLHATFEGAPVRAGQPLVDLYSPELVTAQEELLLARRLDRALPPGGFSGTPDAGGRAGGDASTVDVPPEAGGELARREADPEGLEQVARRRLAYWDVPDAQVERLLETGEVQKTMTLEAPATGVVMKKRAFEGQGVKAGENLFMIAPTDPVWIEAEVHEQDLPFVREGHPAEVTVEGLPGRTFRGRVTYLYPELRESTRTVRARIEVPNPRGDLRPGLYATARIESRTDSVLSVPSSAVLHTGTRSVVFMAMGENRLMPTTLETGRAGEERVEVLRGLEPGTRVATSAQFLLDSEANLMEAMQAMMAEMGRAGEDDTEMDDMEMEDR